ncbi:hypothetical protein BC835DRAFT_917013 [Cytidiella melzeri]|nr:hypothetical protein BC835DRAFT_917013 [Cytidiella melzeri]
MSLSSFLLGTNAANNKGKAIDKGLDDLFQSTITAAAPSVKNSVVKPPDAFITSTKERKRKEAPAEAGPVSHPTKGVRGPKAQVLNQTTPHKKARTAKVPAQSSDSEEDKVVEGQEADEDSAGDQEATAGPSTIPAADAEISDSDDEEGDPSKLVHESLLQGSRSRSSPKKKYVPAEETPEQRVARTIFVGNVPVEVVTSRPLQKQFKRHILSFVPNAKIESIRFRSVAFSKPTTQSDAAASKGGRQHNRDRAASWRNSNSKAGEDADEEAAADKGKTFLTQQEKKRIFFIKQELHSGVDSVNAYVVFAHPTPPTGNRPSTLMDPHEAAKIVIREADGGEFHGHSVRVDSALRGKSKGQVGELGNVEVAEDPKATVFVGSLDFACKEEDVRAFFEKLMVEERGAPGVSGKDEHGNDEEEEDAKQDGGKVKATWVKRVRIIRDKDTLLGKGFGYVQFTDRSCVDEVLALEETRLKFAKRKLRVQRCKTLPGSSKPVKPASLTNTKISTPRKPQDIRSSVPIVVPKGDPTLGSKLASLSKEERKQVKSSDADRVARRLAKKKAKALADKGVKSRGANSAKDRERVRKRPAKDARAGAPPERRKAKTGRVRSGKALAKMNVKK